MCLILWVSRPGEVFTQHRETPWGTQDGVVAATEVESWSLQSHGLGCVTDFGVSQVQTEVLQKRQREKAHMMNAIKKYQKGQCVCLLRV